MNTSTQGRTNSNCNSRRNSVSNTHKVYEQMLLKALPGIKRPNQPMHAVLESSMDDLQNGMEDEAQKVRNHALIHYLASLASSNSEEDTFDFDFVESLIVNGANINSTDKSGQTIFHEVARSWNLDVASFLIEHGANANQQDKFGRSPLHVAAAVDYAEMVRFLIKNGADINIATNGEGQMPIHYAAKNDACKSLKMLIGYGANVDSRDGKNRTPLQVAAEMNRAKSSKLLVNHGAPAGVSDDMGNSTLSILIEKLPDVAIEALGQFHSVSIINRKEFFFLNYLEGNRLQDPKSPAYTALEIAVQHQEFDIILHPVMQRLILVKWQKFGRLWAITDLAMNLVYAILWSVLAVTSPIDGKELYLPWSEKAWRLAIFVIVCLMTLDEIRRQITGTLKTRNRQKKWIAWRVAELEEDLSYCHPRWPQEEIYLKTEIKAIRETPLISTGDNWIYFDWFSLILILGTIASHLVFFDINTKLTRVIYIRFITMLILVLWFRILKYARPFEGAGPFVVIFGHISKDIVNWLLLLTVIFIPYACAFWITFGGTSPHPVESYSNLSPFMYNLFSMVVVNDHDFDSLEKENATMARLLCGTYIGIMAIINLNLLIALLSDTFTRVYGNAVANSVMQRAKTILLLEKSLRSKKKLEYQNFIKNNGSPETVDLERDITTSSDRDEQKASELLRDNVKDIHTLVNERFGKQYGEVQKSDFDVIKEGLQQMEECKKHERNDVNELKLEVKRIHDILIKLSHSLDVDISYKDRQSSSDDGSFPKTNEKDEKMSLADTIQELGRRKDKENNNETVSYHPRDITMEEGVVNECFELENLKQSQWKVTESQPREQALGTRKARDERRRETHRSSREQSPGGSPIAKPRYEGGRTHMKTREEFRAQAHEQLREPSRVIKTGESRGESRGGTRIGSPRVVRRGSSCSSVPLSQRYRRGSEHHEEIDDPYSIQKRENNVHSDLKYSPQLSRSSYNKREDMNGRKGHRATLKSEANGGYEKRHEKATKPRMATYKRDNEGYYDQSFTDTDDDTSESGSEDQVSRNPVKRSLREEPRAFHSDNEVTRKKRQRPFKDKRSYDNWDNRSIKSVTF